MASSSKSDKGKKKEIARKDVRFDDEAAMERFERIKGLPCIFERGFELEEQKKWSIPYLQHIKAMHWEVFCRPRPRAVMQLVYEFYANIPEKEGEPVFVRGKLVDYSANMINDMFNLDKKLPAGIGTILKTTSVEQLAAVICQTPEPEWTTRAKTVMRAPCLNREAKVWLLFVNSSLFPTKHGNTVPMEKVALLYCILKGLKVNVGRIIETCIFQKSQENPPRQLWFPTLITELCLGFGVKLNKDDLVTNVRHCITKTVIQRNVKVEEKAKAEEFGEEPPVGLEHVDIPMANGVDTDVMMEHLDYTKSYLRYHHLYMDSYMEYIRKNQELIMDKLKLPVPEPVIRYKNQFDAQGYLLTSDGTRCDPHAVAEAEEAMRAEFDSEEEDVDGANEEEVDKAADEDSS